MSLLSESTRAVPVTISRKPKTDEAFKTDDSCAPADGGRLDLTAKLFQESLWPSVTAAGRGERLKAPLVVELDPTSFCDMRCPECISSDLLNQSRFTRDRLLGLATEFADLGVRAVILIGGGEPLLHNGVGDVIDILGHSGVAIGLTTNGTMIHRHLTAVARFVNWTRVSVDAGTAECFERFRPHRSGRNVFGAVIENMRRLATAKTGSLGYSFLLVARTAPDGSLTDSNFGDVAKAALLARDIGCDYFEVKPMYDMAHFLVAQPPDLGDLLANQLAHAHAAATEDFAVIAPRTLSTVTVDRQYAEPKDYHHCPVTELRTLITSTGAYACPYHRGNPAARYGDPTTESFAAMWSGDLRESVKTDIDPSTACRFHCIRHESNLTLLRLAHEDLSHEVVADYDPFI